MRKIGVAVGLLLAACGGSGGGGGGDAARMADARVADAAGGDARPGDAAPDARVRDAAGTDALAGDAAGRDALAGDAGPDARGADAEVPTPDAGSDAHVAGPDAQVAGPDAHVAAPDALAADARATDALPPDAAPFGPADVQALFAERCAGCHVGAALSGLRLDPDWIAATLNRRPQETGRMPLLWAGDRQRSYLFRKLAGTHVAAGGIGARQPPGGPYLDEATLEKVGAVIDALPPDPPPPEAGCSNERDEDFDGLVDCADPDCADAPRCRPHPPEDCANGADDDLDGFTDCDDPECFAAPACAPQPEVCDDGLDNDRDGQLDCCDTDCAGVGACAPLPVEPFTTDQVQAVIDTACLGCHAPPMPAGARPLDLSAPFTDATIGVMSGEDPLPYITPGDRSRSYLYVKIAGLQIEGTAMPADERLCAGDIERIGLWIDGLRE
jgi:hypothetical protein